MQNRIYKFRAWDNKKKKMWLPYVNTTMTYGECIDDFEDDVLMQHTGLSDKNGKEIYEGDIVKYPSFEEGELKLEVIFRDAKFSPFGQGLIYSEKCEIIGNIFENPELLK